ncbi:MAG: hypothetical protein M1828_003067 [Chrysothrix sp. TS-e1954]|nr:MAG: hypothetical protein M1828_003067 [Chrysothrix sp. TS-e1954]
MKRFVRSLAQLAVIRAIVSEVEQERLRPIIFIAHSLGGLIVKKVRKPEIQYFDPHEGLRAQFRIQLNKDFKEVVGSLQTRCVSFYERQRTKKTLLFVSTQHIVVSRESATLDITGEVTVPINADHSTIVRYRSAEDHNFSITLGHLRDCILGPTSPIEERPQPPPKHRNTHYLAPRMGRFFIGRDAELQRLHDQFFPPAKPRPLSRSVGLIGQSGLGKTQLALKYAVINRDQYDYVIYLNATSADSLRNDLAKLHKTLQPAEEGGDAVSGALTWLAETEDVSWLVIFDNANDLQDIKDIVASVSPAGHIILTTQDARIESSDLVDSAFRLELLSPEEAKNLLLSRAQLHRSTADDVDVASQVVKELGLLPLAADSFGAYIHVRHKTVQQCRMLFRSAPRHMLSYRPELASHASSVLASLELSFETLDDDASLLVSLLACLDHAEVTEELLRRGTCSQPQWSKSGEKEYIDPASVGISRTIIDLTRSEVRFDKAVEDLTALSLVQITSVRESGRSFAMHPLIHHCARLRLDKEKLHEMLRQALSIVSHVAPEGGEISKERKDYESNLE